MGRAVAILVVLAAVLVGGSLVRDRLGQAQAPPLPAQRPFPVPGPGAPPGFAAISSEMAQVRARAPLGRLGSILRGGGTAARRSVAPIRPFADVGPDRQIRRLKRQCARDLRRAELEPAAWQGVFVSGRRALAVVDLERPRRRVKLSLERSGGRWRVVSGLPG